MQEIVEAAVVRLGRPPSEATRFVELFSLNWIESLEDYMAYHHTPQLGKFALPTGACRCRVTKTVSPAGQVPVKLHAALMAMARERNVQGDDRRDEVSDCLSLAHFPQENGKKKRDACCLTGHVSGVLDSTVSVPAQ